MALAIAQSEKVLFLNEVMIYSTTAQYQQDGAPPNNTVSV